jgi:transposase
MIAATQATRVFLFEGAVDMRKGFEGLSALVRDSLSEDPTSRHLFVFSNVARNPLKILLSRSKNSLCARLLNSRMRFYRGAR